MKLPTVNNFLCCLKLETGGLIVGWISVIFGGLSILGMIGLIALSIVAINYVDEVEITDPTVSRDDFKTILIGE